MIGLYIRPDKLRAVDLVATSKGFKLRGIAEEPVHLPMPSNLRTLESEEQFEYFLQNFSISVKNILSHRGFSSKDITVAIDIRNTFINTVPFDGNYTPDNVSELINWELTHYFPGIPGNAFLFDTYNPGFNPATDVSPSFIYTAVLRSYIHLLQRGIREAERNLISINVDQFTLDNILKVRESDSKLERLNAICFFYDKILFCSLLWNNRLVRYREYEIDESETPDKNIADFVESISGSQKFVEKRIFYLPYDETFSETIQETTGWKSDRLNTFEHCSLARRVKRNLPDSLHVYEEYAPAISVALKNN